MVSRVHQLSSTHYLLPSSHLSVRPHHPGHGRAFRQSRGATAGSGLRLCVKDGLLQACVLLATQGDNSRIRWSSSQDCQHVLSSDLRPYNKKLLGTSSALHQEVALPADQLYAPVNFLNDTKLRSRCGCYKEVERPSTVRSYDQKWLKFETFTSQVKDDAGAPRMSVLPASSRLKQSSPTWFTSSKQDPSSPNRR